MQVKPRFKSYKILEQHPILTDDTGNEICLTLLEVILPSNSSEISNSPYSYWTVIGKKQEIWNNKAVSYSSWAFFKPNERDRPLLKQTINDIQIEEIDDGYHSLFITTKAHGTEEYDKLKGYKTTFRIEKK